MLLPREPSHNLQKPFKFFHRYLGSGILNMGLYFNLSAPSQLHSMVLQGFQPCHTCISLVGLELCLERLWHFHFFIFHASKASPMSITLSSTADYLRYRCPPLNSFVGFCVLTPGTHFCRQFLLNQEQLQQLSYLGFFPSKEFMFLQTGAYSRQILSLESSFPVVPLRSLRFLFNGTDM